MPAPPALVKSAQPAWLSEARVFYSRIDAGSTDPVSVFIPPVGDVTARIWLFGFEPGRETPDLLAAVALLHRNWWRW